MLMESQLHPKMQSHIMYVSKFTMPYCVTKNHFVQCNACVFSNKC